MNIKFAEMLWYKRKNLVIFFFQSIVSHKKFNANHQKAIDKYTLDFIDFIIRYRSFYVLSFQLMSILVWFCAMVAYHDDCGGLWYAIFMKHTILCARVI